MMSTRKIPPPSFASPLVFFCDSVSALTAHLQPFFPCHPSPPPVKPLFPAAPPPFQRLSSLLPFCGGDYRPLHFLSLCCSRFWVFSFFFLLLLPLPPRPLDGPSFVFGCRGLASVGNLICPNSLLPWSSSLFPYFFFESSCKVFFEEGFPHVVGGLRDSTRVTTRVSHYIGVRVSPPLRFTP